MLQPQKGAVATGRLATIFIPICSYVASTSSYVVLVGADAGRSLYLAMVVVACSVMTRGLVRTASDE